MKLLEYRSLNTTMICIGILVLSMQAAHGCGEGRVTAMKEGGWDMNHFLFKIDNSVKKPETLFHGWIRLRKDVMEKRDFNKIRSMVYLSFARNSVISVGGDCSSIHGLGTPLIWTNK